MVWRWWVVELLVVSLVGSWAVETPLFGQKMIVDHINSLQTSWKAGINRRFLGLSQEQIRRQMGALEGGPELPEKHYPITDVPDSFDCRHGWDNCPSVRKIRDQGSCGSCWAVAAAEVISDRFCIFHNESIYISEEDLFSCCISCGKGCEGGYPSAAWKYWIANGLVTGGAYDSHQGCQPYRIEPCNHRINPELSDHSEQLTPCSAEVKTPNCSRACEPGYSIPYGKDKHFGVNAFTYKTPGSIQFEIMTNGPVEATMNIFEDFLSYKEGVYRHHTGQFLGNHSVRIVGWGEEITDSPYWTVANSWNSDWGNKGFFQILRGKNEVGIESSVIAGMPKKHVV